MNRGFEPLFQLGRADRLQLVEDLWDSIAQEDAPLPVLDWKGEELRRRKVRLSQHPSSNRSWEQEKRRARTQQLRAPAYRVSQRFSESIFHSLLPKILSKSRMPWMTRMTSMPSESAR
jgi:putative addiction module component (TIGR02574 family)